MILSRRDSESVILLRSAGLAISVWVLFVGEGQRSAATKVSTKVIVVVIEVRS
jgi:hypothetical protein